VVVIFGYDLRKSQIRIHTEPGFPVPCKLLTDIINFLLGQSSYVFLPRTLLLKLTVHWFSTLKGSQQRLYIEVIRKTQHKLFTFY